MVADILRRMAKKKTGLRYDTTFKFRCRSDELELFRHASNEEGFGGNISAWLLYHARNQAKQHENTFPAEKLPDGEA